MPSAHELVDSCDNLFSLPEIYLRVRDIVDDPDSSIEDLAKVLAMDPGITARILQVVNSPLYGLSRPVGSVTQAVSLLGMQPIQNIVLTTSVSKAFPKIHASVMNMTDYWRRSVRCGLLAGSFAKHAGLEHADECFVLGLLREVGHLIMYQMIPERAQSALVEASHLRQPVANVEQENIGCDYTEVGAELMHRWGMPKRFESAIRYQMDPAEAGDDTTYACLLYASGRLSELLEEATPEETLKSEDAMAALKVVDASADHARDIIAAAENQLQQMLSLICPSPLAAAA